MPKSRLGKDRIGQRVFLCGVLVTRAKPVAGTEPARIVYEDGTTVEYPVVQFDSASEAIGSLRACLKLESDQAEADGPGPSGS